MELTHGANLIKPSLRSVNGHHRNSTHRDKWITFDESLVQFKTCFSQGRHIFAKDPWGPLSAHRSCDISPHPAPIG